jgi:prepilin-type N-terminal cleavage/methylation domain-containing protein
MASLIQTSSRPGRGGFTLTEILVVIAIVGVLATLMFSFVRRGMEKAKAAQCVSNLRDCGVRFSTYLFDGKILQYEYV